MIGRLPFDDSNHRELLKQVRKGPTFPEKREISNECKNLISRILVRREDRPAILMIKQHIWYRRRIPSDIAKAIEAGEPLPRKFNGEKPSTSAESSNTEKSGESAVKKNSKRKNKSGKTQHLEAKGSKDRMGAASKKSGNVYYSAQSVAAS